MGGLRADINLASHDRIFVSIILASFHEVKLPYG